MEGDILTWDMGDLKDMYEYYLGIFPDLDLRKIKEAVSNGEAKDPTEFGG